MELFSLSNLHHQIHRIKQKRKKTGNSNQRTRRRDTKRRRQHKDISPLEINDYTSDMKEMGQIHHKDISPLQIKEMGQIQYSDKYFNDIYEYRYLISTIILPLFLSNFQLAPWVSLDFHRHVVLPPEVAKLLPKNRLLSEASSPIHYL